MEWKVVCTCLIIVSHLVTAAEVDPNKALFDYVSIELVEREEYYVTNLPKNISHQFMVSFVFPERSWHSQFEDSTSDEFYCFADKLRRRLKNVYYRGVKNYEKEYDDASIIRFRNDTYLTADFNLHFQRSLPWPAWNQSRVAALFPAQQKPLLLLYTYPEINSSRNPFINYTEFEIEWFSVIEDKTNMFSEAGAFAYFGFYNITPPPPTYTGPEYTSLVNLVMYGFLGFNIFVIFLALFFWFINCKREKLLLSYWFREELSDKFDREITPGDL